VSVDAESKQHTIDTEGRTLASARCRAVAAAIRAIDVEIESLADLARKLKGNQPQ
jgi:hypothetical protein